MRSEMPSKMIALLTLCFFFLAGPGQALAEYACGQDLNGDGYADGEGETALCTQAGSNWFCPVGAVDCTTSFSEAVCPAGGTIDPERDVCQAPGETFCPAGYSHDTEIDRCVREIECSEGGTYNPITDRCEKLVVNECPSGYSYDASLDVCKKTVNCSPGTLNPSRDRCETLPSWECPTGFSYNPSLGQCTATPSCSSGSTYNSVRDRCEQTATNQCPDGYTYDVALDDCVRAAECPSPSSLNTGTERCEVGVGYDCPEGYTYNSSRNQCEKDPACLSPGSYSAGADTCQASSTGTTCPYGYTYDSALETCTAAPVCVGGTYNAGTDRCESWPSYSCPDSTYSYNASTGRCEKDPVCPQGTYSPTYDQCLLDYTVGCPSGFSYNAAAGRCEMAPACGSGTYNPATNMCEEGNYACSVGGQTFSSLSECQSSCDETATCEQSMFNTSGGPFGASGGGSYKFIGSGDYLTVRTGSIYLGSGVGASGGGSDSRNSSYPVKILKIYGSGSKICAKVHGSSRAGGQTFYWCVNIPGATITGSTPERSDWDDIRATSPNKITLHRYYCTGTTGGRKPQCKGYAHEYSSILLEGLSCPLAGGACDSSGTCSVAGSCDYSFAQNTPDCGSGTLDGNSDVCYATMNPECPGGMVYDAASNKCVAAAACSNGLLDTAADECYQDQTTSCPSGYTLNGNTCVKDPACDSVGIFTASSDLCTYAATFNCPSGYSYNPSTQKCERAPNCPSPGALNGSVDMCQTGVATTCPSGYAQTGNICYRAPVCSAPGNYSSTQDQCLSAVDRVCGTGLGYDAAASACWGEANCGTGTLNPSADRCESAAAVNCGSWSWDGTAGSCYSPPVCDSGAYNASADECRASIARNCGGYFWDETAWKCTQSVLCPNLEPGFPTSGTITFSSGLDVCVADPRHDCPSSYTYSSLPVAMCEAEISCPDGPYDPDLNQCQGEDTCPLGSQYACVGEQGASQCSPNICVDLADPGNDISELPEEDTVYMDDGEVDDDGTCLGQLYIFSGKATRCRPPGLTVGYVNDCCANDEPALGDSTTGNRVVTAVKAAKAIYEVAQVGYYAYQISTGAMTAAASATGAVTVTSTATGAAVASFSSGSAIGAGAVAAQGAVAGGAATSGALGSAMTAYMGALLNPATIIIAIVVMVVMKVLMGSGCDQKDIETALYNDSDYCHYLGTVCERKWAMVGCVQKAKRFCCFNSKMARIIHEQGRPQLKTFGPDGGWGDKKNPNCRGFTPEEFQQLDFAKIDMSEYFGDITKNMSQKVQDTQEQIQQGIQQHYDQIR